MSGAGKYAQALGELLRLSAGPPDRRALRAALGVLAGAARVGGAFSLVDPARPFGVGAADRALVERVLERIAGGEHASSFVDDRTGHAIRLATDHALRGALEGERPRRRSGRTPAPLVLGGLVTDPRREPPAALLEPAAAILGLWLARRSAELELTARQRALELGQALSAGLLEESDSPLGLDRLLERLRAIVPCDALSLALPADGGLRAIHAVPAGAHADFLRAIHQELVRSIGAELARADAGIERVARLRPSATAGARAPRAVRSSLVLAIPDPDGGAPGFLGLYAGRAGALQPRHLRMVALVVPWLGGALVSARPVRADRLEARGRRHEMARARAVQQELEPARTALVAVEVASHASAADGLSGDVHEIVQLPDGRTGIFVGDVCGHGAPAAVVGSYVRGLLRRAWDGATPSGLLAMLNAELRSRASKSIEMMFVTACAAIFSPATATLTYASAGHPPPVLRAADGAKRLGAGGVPLGAFDGQIWEDSSERMRPGDVVVFYTDGVSEALPDGLLERSIVRGSPEDTVRALAAAAAEFPDRDDDRTVIALRVL